MASNVIRVLVVEPSVQYRRQLIAHLEQAENFEIQQARGTGDALWADAQAKIREYRAHVVVVGLRLEKPGDRADRTGLELAETLKKVARTHFGVVIYAPEPDVEVAYDAGWQHWGYICHADPRQKLTDSVHQQDEESRKQRVIIDWPQDDFGVLVADSLKMSPDEVAIEDLHALLEDVFPDAMALQLTPLPSLQTRALVASPVRRSIVLRVQEKRFGTNVFLTPKVLKIGPSERIDREVNNYRRYVDGWLVNDRQARLEGNTLRWHLGAVAYAFLGASPERMDNFRQFYTSNSAGRILDALKELFVDTCQRWYAQTRVRQETSLFDLYDERMGLTKHLDRLAASATTRLTFDGFPEALPHPKVWVLKEGCRIIPGELRECITHGDLHADNFFVDRSGAAWLIDFEQTGPGHALRDFVELEADVKLRLTTPAGDGLTGLATLERSLLTGRTLGAMFAPPAEVIADPALHKAFQVIAGLRHLAHITTGVALAREYHLSLLFETLFMATLERLRPEVQDRALFSAALITERLTQRTGLLGLPPMIPHLDLNAIRQGSRAQAVAIVDQHMKHLDFCREAARLQAKLYNGKEAPPELADGLSQLQDVYAQAQRVRQALR